MRTTVSKKKEQTHTNEKKETERKKEKRDKEEGKTKRPSGITAESIDQSIGRQRVAVNSSHCFVTDRAARANEGSRGRGDEEDESYPVDRTNSCLSPCGIDCESHSMSPSRTARWLSAQFTSDITLDNDAPTAGYAEFRDTSRFIRA